MDSFDAVPDYEIEDPEEINNTIDPASATDPYSKPFTQLYFVRIPRPVIDDSKIKRLQQEFYASIDKVKSFNGRIQAKKSVLSELRRQIGDARSLRDTARPAFQEKLKQLKQLRELMSSLVAQTNDIKSTIKGFDCKSEEELEARIKEMEDTIQHERVSLKEEKLMIQQISKLKAQRGKMKEYTSQKSSLTELESEKAKIHKIIVSLESEYDIVKSENEQAQGIFSDLQKKLNAADKELQDVLEEQNEVAKIKNEIGDKLQAAKAEMEVVMSEWRNNRNFSAQVRDLVQAQQIEEATSLCSEQVDTYIEKLKDNAAYRSTYVSLWGEQRKYAVSALVSGKQVVKDTKQPKDNRGNKGGAASVQPLVNRGAEKAQALIAAALQEVSKEYESSRTGRVNDFSEVGVVGADFSEPAPVPSLKPLPVKPLVAAPRPVPKLEPSADQPKSFDYDFVVPVTKVEAEVLSAEELKQKVREEQRVKQQEAELRKKKKSEQMEKKKQKVAQSKVEDPPEPKAAPAKAKVAPAVPEASVDAPEEGTTEPEVEKIPSPVKASKVTQKNKQIPMPALKPPAVARRPKDDRLLPRVLKMLKQNQTLATVSAVVLVLLILVVAYLSL